MHVPAASCATAACNAGRPNTYSFQCGQRVYEYSMHSLCSGAAALLPCITPLQLCAASPLPAGKLSETTQDVVQASRAAHSLQPPADSAAAALQRQGALSPASRAQRSGASPLSPVSSPPRRDPSGGEPANPHRQDGSPPTDAESARLRSRPGVTSYKVSGVNAVFMLECTLGIPARAGLGSVK